MNLIFLINIKVYSLKLKNFFSLAQICYVKKILKDDPLRLIAG